MSKKYKVYTSKLIYPKLAPKGIDFERDISPAQTRCAVQAVVDKIIEENALKDYFSIIKRHDDTHIEVTVTSVIHEYLERIDELKCLVDFHKDRVNTYESKYYSEQLSNASFVNKLTKALKILSENNLMEQYIKEGGLE